MERDAAARTLAVLLIRYVSRVSLLLSQSCSRYCKTTSQMSMPASLSYTALLIRLMMFVRMEPKGNGPLAQFLDRSKYVLESEISTDVNLRTRMSMPLNQIGSRSSTNDL